MHRPFSRVAIVNRGEAAMRFIQAARELTAEGQPITSIALYTEPERYALFSREADESFLLGPASFLDPRDGHRKPTYLDYERVAHALRATRAEAVWVGWGFVAEHAAFADLCAQMGLVFIGPSGDVMRRLGDKITSKKLAESAGVPIVPWSGGAVDTLDAARDAAAAIGFPLVIKATAGGGGRGIRHVDSEADLGDAYERARAEALRAFGDGTVFLERKVQGAKHVEVQVVADLHGTAWALGVRDCSVQRRNQKVIEEAPSPVLSEAQDRALRDAAVRLAHAANYENAGTVEFLLDTEGCFWFMEVNARLQVEHPVTEMTTGCDLVKMQVHVARGGVLDGEPPARRGHAVEVRLNAEDPDAGFSPAPGVVETFVVPSGPGVRVDTGVSEGDTVPREFDSMIAKIIAWGQTRDEAIARLQRALAQSRVVVRDGTTNKPFLLDLLSRPEVREATADVGWLDRQALTTDLSARRGAEFALIRSAIEAYERESEAERRQFFSWAGRGRPQATGEVGRVVELGYAGNSYQMGVHRLGARTYRVEIDGLQIPVHVSPVSSSPLRERRAHGSEWRLTCGERTCRVNIVTQSLGYLVEVDGLAHRVSRDNAGIVRATAPAIVVSLAVRPGDEVRQGDRLLVLEAMKMELVVYAPFDGRVREVAVAPGVQVATGATVVVIEPSEQGQEGPVAPRVAFTPLVPNGAARSNPVVRRGAVLDNLLALVLGYDIDAAALGRTMQEWNAVCATAPIDDDAEGLAREDRVLDCFVDIVTLFDRRPEEQDTLRRAPVSQEVHLFEYLRTLDASDERLPASFLAALGRALGHYGVATPERSPEVREALFRMFKAHQREEKIVGAVTAILERRLQQVESLQRYVNEPARALLDRLIAATQRRHPSLNDLAREVRYRLFDQSLLDRARREVYERAAADYARLAADDCGPARDTLIHSLVHCPQPLASFLLGRLRQASPEMRATILEVMSRRYYRIRKLENVRSEIRDGHTFVAFEYSHDGKRHIGVMTHAERSTVREVARLAQPLLDLAPNAQPSLDLCVWQDDPLGEADANADAFRRMLDDVARAGRVDSIVVELAGQHGGFSLGGMQHFTYRRDGDGYVEDKFYRNAHPMIAKRLHLWRLQHFDFERLPSVVEDCYIIHAVARSNPRDERLFGIGEVRDLTAVRDTTGTVVQLPQLERMFMEAAAGVRRAQARRPPDRRLYWNRLLFYIWPPLELRPDELSALAVRMAPATADLGLEAIVLRCRVPHGETLRDTAIVFTGDEHGLSITFRDPPTEPMRPVSAYEMKVVRSRQLGLVYPYELLKMIAAPMNGGGTAGREIPAGEFFEHDFNGNSQLVPVNRPPGQNQANIIVGVVRNFTPKYPEGMTRVVLLGDPTRDLGALAEPECRRIIAAIDLAEQKRVPLEWFALSAGAKIAMDSGTENMDWIALVLRRLVNFTQHGGEVNIIVNGINVGAQPYWNAEATMLMHTRGVLIMMPDSAMVLTGKRALDYSGGVSAEDNQGIGGFERVMGPNGEAQYFARDIRDAIRILFRHYEHTHIAPGELFPRRAATTDVTDRNVCLFPYGPDHGFRLVGDVFSDEMNPGRKKAFDIRRVMSAVTDQDLEPLERWSTWRDAEMTVVWDAHLGGWPVELIGLESRPIQRIGFTPADGPEQWTAGTLFPQSSRKMARAINAASGNRPVVILANLSGFDGSPESLRKWQLEYGAEIGRAVVNFRGPIIFCVISRYHGGAFVVFSNALNANLEVAALEGTYASVIGGAPAAAVVFAREVEKRTSEDRRVQDLERAIREADGAERSRLRTRLTEVKKEVKAAKISELAEEFDHVHSVHRAQRVGSVHEIIRPGELRPYLIAAVQRGIHRELHATGRERAIAKEGASITASILSAPGTLVAR